MFGFRLGGIKVVCAVFAAVSGAFSPAPRVPTTFCLIAGQPSGRDQRKIGPKRTVEDTSPLRRSFPRPDPLTCHRHIV
jgi:hypothetical protein